jgi:hypothetical protein
MERIVAHQPVELAEALQIHEAPPLPAGRAERHLSRGSRGRRRDHRLDHRSDRPRTQILQPLLDPIEIGPE